MEEDSRAEEEGGGKVDFGGGRAIAQGKCRIMMAPPPTKVARGADIAEAGRRRQQKEEEEGKCPKYSPHSRTKGRKAAPEHGGRGREMDGDGRVQKMSRPATATTTTTTTANSMCKRKRGRPPRKKREEAAAVVPKGGGGELRAVDAEGDTCEVTLSRSSSDARMMLQSPLCSSPGLNAGEEEEEGGSSRDQERTAAGEIKGRRSLCRRQDEKPAEEKGRRRFNGGGGGRREGGNKFVLNKKAVDVVVGGGEGGEGGERGAVKKSSTRKEAIQDAAPTKTKRKPGMVLPDEVIRIPAAPPRRPAYGCVFAGPDSLFQEVEDQMLSEAMM